MNGDLDVMGAEDVAILRLESPTIAGHTCKVLTLASSRHARLTVEALREHVAGRLDRVPRMTSRLSANHEQPSWEPDPGFDIRDHVKAWPLSRPASGSELLDIVAERMTTRLDRTRPLWSIDLVELEDERIALVVLLHHAMVDGASAVRVLAAVLWDAVAAEDAPPAPHPPGDRSASTASAFDLRGVIRRELIPHGIDTPLDRHPSAQRRVAFTRAHLPALRHVGKSVGDGGTVNDVVLCAVAGGLRRWLERHAGPLHDVRVKVPVSLHDAHEASDAVGNHDSFLVVDLGVDDPDPATRLRDIVARTRAAKSRHDAGSLDRLVRDLRRVSGRAAAALVAWSDDPRVSAVNVSNVPGPPAPVAVMGRTVTGLGTLAEIGDRHALRVAVISMADQLTFGLCADAAAVPDPDVVADGIASDLATLGAGAVTNEAPERS